MSSSLAVGHAAADASSAVGAGATGVAGPKGDPGATGPAGPATGAAGGDLSGNYPNPSIGDGKVGSAEPADGAVTGPQLGVPMALASTPTPTSPAARPRASSGRGHLMTTP
jgi:hypothetical protein